MSGENLPGVRSLTVLEAVKFHPAFGGTAQSTVCILQALPPLLSAPSPEPVPHI